MACSHDWHNAESTQFDRMEKLFWSSYFHRFLIISISCDKMFTFWIVVAYIVIIEAIQNGVYRCLPLPAGSYGFQREKRWLNGISVVVKLYQTLFRHWFCDVRHSLKAGWLGEFHTAFCLHSIWSRKQQTSYLAKMLLTAFISLIKTEKYCNFFWLDEQPTSANRMNVTS